jgi:DUF4097 and DUF4098 domain-containing protein YvlB
MSSYPPPPGQYPPMFDRSALRTQRQMLRAQVKARHAQQRAQRQQFRAQRRSLRQASIVGPLIILAVGIVFLLGQMGRLSWSRSLDWYGRWWPGILIASGAILLVEWAVDQKRRSGTARVRVIGGGVVFLLILLVLAGMSAKAIEFGLDWRNHAFGNGYTKWDHLYGDRHDTDSSMNSPIPTASTLIIRNPHGDVTVSGSSSDGQVHVNVHTRTYAWKDSDAMQKAKELQPGFVSDNGILSLNVRSVEGGESDLTVEMPRSSPVTIEADRGGVTVNEMSAPVTISANHGDVDVRGIDNNVTLHVNDDDSGVTLHSIHGLVSVQGHSGDIEISDVTGNLSLQGDFFGSTHLEHVNGEVRFSTTRTQFSAARLDQEFSVDKDSLNASRLLGPVALKTADKNITLDGVQGGVDINNRNGSIALTNAAPLQAISIQNQRGSVDVGLPGASGFELNARTNNGDLENDFGLTSEKTDGSNALHGRVAGGGPTVTITTTDGDVTVRRSTTPPLPPLTSAPGIRTVPTFKMPPKPPHPSAPSAPSPPPPSAPSAPSAPPPPSDDTF